MQLVCHTSGGGTAMKKLDVICLWMAMLVPFLYLGTLLLSAHFYPGYSHVRQAASELGARGAPRPEIFNVGFVVIAAAILTGAVGYFRALQRLGAGKIWTWLTASVLVGFAVACAMAGMFPFPDARHAGRELGLVIIFAPGLLAIALRKRREARLLNLYSIASGLLLVVTVAMMMGVGGIVTPANDGLAQRITALAVYPWIGVCGYGLNALARRARPPHNPPPHWTAAAEGLP
jgi:glucan biosynthesis protein C